MAPSLVLPSVVSIAVAVRVTAPVSERLPAAAATLVLRFAPKRIAGDERLIAHAIVTAPLTAIVSVPVPVLMDRLVFVCELFALVTVTVSLPSLDVVSIVSPEPRTNALVIATAPLVPETDKAAVTPSPRRSLATVSVSAAFSVRTVTVPTWRNSTDSALSNATAFEPMVIPPLLAVVAFGE